MTSYQNSPQPLGQVSYGQPVYATTTSPGQQVRVQQATTVVGQPTTTYSSIGKPTTTIYSSVGQPTTTYVQPSTVVGQPVYAQNSSVLGQPATTSYIQQGNSPTQPATHYIQPGTTVGQPVNGYGQPVYGQPAIGGYGQPANAGGQQPLKGYGKPSGYENQGLGFEQQQHRKLPYDASHKNRCGISCILIVDCLILLGLAGNFGGGISQVWWYIFPTVIFTLLLIWALYALYLECSNTRTQSSFNSLISYAKARVCLGWVYLLLAIVALTLGIIFAIMGTSNLNDQNADKKALGAVLIGVSVFSFVSFVLLLVNVIWFCCSSLPLMAEITEEHSGVANLNLAHILE